MRRSWLAPVVERGLLDQGARPPAADEVDEPVNPAVALDDPACPLPCGLDVEEVDWAVSAPSLNSAASASRGALSRPAPAVRPSTRVAEQRPGQEVPCAGNRDHPVVERSPPRKLAMRVSSEVASFRGDRDLRRAPGHVSRFWPTVTLRSIDVERTVVVVHSISFDVPDQLIPVFPAYEERFLCMVLSLLRAPRSRVVYVTSQPIHPRVVDYYFGLVPELDTPEARARFVPVSLVDGRNEPLCASSSPGRVPFGGSRSTSASPSSR